MLKQELSQEIKQLWLDSYSDSMNYDEFIDMFCNDAVKCLLIQINERKYSRKLKNELESLHHYVANKLLDVYSLDYNSMTIYLDIDKRILNILEVINNENDDK